MPETSKPLYVHSTTAAGVIAAWLLYESQRFGLEPLPCDYWKLTVQPDIRQRIWVQFGTLCSDVPPDMEDEGDIEDADVAEGWSPPEEDAAYLGPVDGKGDYERRTEISDVITKCIRDFNGEEPSGHGCRPFYSPEEWMRKGEQYGMPAKLIVCHDGGDFAPFFNYDYGQYKAIAAMADALKQIGYYAEQCTAWYSAICEIRRVAPTRSADVG